MKPIINIAYYKEEDWQRLLNCVDDRSTMHETWAEWHRAFIDAKKGLKAQGMKVIVVTIDIEELKAFCKAKGIKNDSQARSEFVTRR